VIESGARIGQNVTIGPFSVIERDVVIGDRSVLGPHVHVLGHATIGEACRIHAGAVIGDLPQDLGFKDEVSYVRIGRQCVIREHVTIHRGTKAGTVTEVGNQCFLMAHSHVAHNAKLGDRVIMANGALLAGYVEVGDRAFISGNAGVHQFCRIGTTAMIGGGAIVTKDVPPYCTVRTNSLNAVVGLNAVGMRRAGLSTEERMGVKRVFGLLYRSGLNVTQAMSRIRDEYPTGVGQLFADFVEQSHRGICRLSTVQAADGEE
jgi:UDP-N-acetylglucosamine acyltransferase